MEYDDEKSNRAIKNIEVLSVISLLSVALSDVFAAQTYDLVILNGGVMDPKTRLDAMRNVGVKTNNRQS